LISTFLFFLPQSPHAGHRMHHEQPWRGEEGSVEAEEEESLAPGDERRTPRTAARKAGARYPRDRGTPRRSRASAPAADSTASLQRRNAPGHGSRSPSSPPPGPYPDFQRLLPAADALRRGQAPRRSPATSPGRRWRRRRCVPGRATTARPRHAPAARLRLLRAAAAGSELLMRMRPAHCGSLRRAARR